MDSIAELMDETELKTLADHCDMYRRLSLTLSQPDIDQTVTGATVLQLAGGVEQQRYVGNTDRGDIHLAIVSGADTQLSQFIDSAQRLAPGTTQHMNGTNTTLAGAVGSVKGGDLTPGPLLDSDVDFTFIEQIDATGKKTTGAIQQILDTQSYSFAKSNFRDTVSAEGSVTIAVNPTYGEWDPYEPIEGQLNLSPEVRHSVDLVLVNGFSDVTPVENEFLPEEVDPIDPEVAREYLEHARTYNPTLTDDAEAELNEFVAKIADYLNEDADEPDIGRSRLKASLVRLTQAHARIGLSETVSTGDAKRVVQLVETALNNRGIDPNTGKFDAEVVETGTSKSQRDRIKNIKQIVEELQGDDWEGAHIEDVLDQAEEDGLDRQKAERGIDKLKQKGEIFEISTDHLHTT